MNPINFGSGNIQEKNTSATPVHYRSASLFAELWAMLVKLAAYGNDEVAARIKQIEPTFTTICLPLLAHMTALTPPATESQDQLMQSANAVALMDSPAEFISKQPKHANNLDLYPS